MAKKDFFVHNLAIFCLKDMLYHLYLNIRTAFSLRNILILHTICISYVWIVMYLYLSLEKQAFNGLLKVIGIKTIYLRIPHIFFIQNLYMQSAKLLLLPSKCKIIFGTLKNGHFSNNAIAILNFSQLLPI